MYLNRKLATILATTLVLGSMMPNALAGTYETVFEQCGIQLQLPPSACTCIAESASEDLTEIQQDLLVAQVTEDSAAMAALTDKFTVADMTTVGAFMSSAPATCSAE